VSFREVADDTGLTFTQLANMMYESGSRVIGTLQAAQCRRQQRHDSQPVSTHLKHLQGKQEIRL